MKASAIIALLSGLGACAMPARMGASGTGLSFFITSVGSGRGADLGGLAGADAHCRELAAAVGAGSRTWHAYLSSSASGDQPAINARDRIGSGPWYNAKGAQVATDVANLHSGTNGLGKTGFRFRRSQHPVHLYSGPPGLRLQLEGPADLARKRRQIATGEPRRERLAHQRAARMPVQPPAGRYGQLQGIQPDLDRPASFHVAVA